MCSGARASALLFKLTRGARLPIPIAIPIAIPIPIPIAAGRLRSGNDRSGGDTSGRGGRHGGA